MSGLLRQKNSGRIKYVSYKRRASGGIGIPAYRQAGAYVHPVRNAGVAELAYALASGASTVRFEGSNPSSSTIFLRG